MTSSSVGSRTGAAEQSRAQSAVRERADGVTKWLLVAGVVSGPLFIGLAVMQGLTRQGFDLMRHPISLLNLGDLGWIQIADFFVTGLLAIAYAIGMRRLLHPGRGGTWGPLLIGAYGAGVFAAGAFHPDPAYGFPPGAPGGVPQVMSWHSALHGLAFGVVVLAVVAAQRGSASWRRGSWPRVIGGFPKLAQAIGRGGRV